MRIWGSEHTFNHSWDTVVTAAWRKYPNPHNTSVKGVDVIDRSIDDQGRLKSHRLMITNWGMPTWVAKIIGLQESVYASEHSIVDPENKTFTLNSRNISMGKVLRMDEHITYTQDPIDPEKTNFKQDVTVTVYGLPFIGRLEKLLTDRSADSSVKGRQAMEWIIDTVQSEAKDFSDSVEKEARKLSMEAQKCMDNVKKEAQEFSDNVEKEAKKCIDNVEKEAKKLSSTLDEAQKRLENVRPVPKSI